MKILVTDRRSIEAGVVVRTPYVVISIRDPGTSKPEIPRPTSLKGVFYTAFHDAEPAFGLQLPIYIVMMNAEQAKAIWRFVDHYRNGINTIVCHCEQGMSRSPAVALALAEVLGEDGDVEMISKSYQPNAYVCRLMRSAIRDRLDEESQ
jgi:predicted protein tyrosine phosphatase